MAAFVLRILERSFVLPSTMDYSRELPASFLLGNGRYDDPSQNAVPRSDIIKRGALDVKACQSLRSR